MPLPKVKIKLSGIDKSSWNTVKMWRLGYWHELVLKIFFLSPQRNISASFVCWRAFFISDVSYLVVSNAAWFLLFVKSVQDRLRKVLPWIWLMEYIWKVSNKPLSLWAVAGTSNGCELTHGHVWWLVKCPAGTEGSWNNVKEAQLTGAEKRRQIEGWSWHPIPKTSRYPVKYNKYERSE